MRKISAAITLCLTMGLFTSLALADDHGKTKDKAEEGWTSLMPEDGLTGWTIDKKKLASHWKNEDGIIVGKNPDKKGSILWTDDAFADYELVADYKTPSKDYDSGIYLRGMSHQVQIGVSRSLKKDLTGALYCPKDKNGSYPQQPDKKIKDAHKLGEWNTLRVVTKGKNIKTYLNGQLINDYDGVKYPDKGKVGLQLHAGVNMEMLFKNIKIKSIENE